MAQVGRPRALTDAGSRPPTSQRGTPEIGLKTGQTTDMLSGRPAPWHQFVDQHEHVPELVWPWSIGWFDQIRSDEQIAALYVSVAFGISRLRFMIDRNGSRPGLAEDIAQDLNLPIKGEDNSPKRRMKRRFAHSKHVGQAMLAALYGHMYFEQNGEIVDGQWRLRKLVPLMPQTISQINVADDGGLVSIRQWNNLGPDGQYQDLEVDRLAAFIFQQEGSSWIGRSMLRDLYRVWLLKDRLLRVEANNHERAGGIPYAEAPMGATQGEIADLDKMMRNFRSGPVAGAGVPYGTKVNIAKGDGGDIDKTVRRYDESMARRFMLMLANLAQGGSHVGSYALADQFHDYFLAGQLSIAQWYCDTMNEHVIEDWVDWNIGEDEELVPILTWERTSEDSLGTEQLALLVQRGIIVVDEELENAIRYRYQLPKRTGPRPEITIGGPKQPNEQVGLGQTPAGTEQTGAGDGQGAPSAQSAPASSQASTGVFDWEQHDPLLGRPHVMAAQGPVMVTVPNIALMEAGVEYNLSTGPTTFTPEDLQDIVTAAMEDPAIPKPRIKIGHVDPRFNGKQYDGSPAFGKFDNLRLSENKMTVYADAVGVPKWLADILPSAFPSRSVEIFWNIESNAGKKWRAVCSAAALLGVTWPGIQQLEDLPNYFGEEKPDDVIVTLPLPAAAGSGEETTMRTDASANLDDVRRAFYNVYIPENQTALWWWIRQVLTDPNELLVEDDETGQLYMIPFSSDAEGNVSFGESTAVRMDFIPDTRDALKTAASFAAAALAETRQVLATYESRASSRPEERGGMDPKEIRQLLSLPEDATDEQVREALQARDAGGTSSTSTEGGTTGVGTGGAEPATPGEEPKPDPPTPPAPTGDREAAEGGAGGATASAGNGDVVQLDRATFEELKRGSAAAIRLEEDNRKTAIENEVAAAVGDGRIPPARKDHWKKMLEADFEGGKATLASIEPGLIPVEQRGVARTNEDGTHADQEQVQNWTEQLFPETRGRRQAEQAAASAGTTRTMPRIMDDRGGL
jgi:hypothetical protein